MTNFEQLDLMIAHEQGELSDKKTIELFQSLIDSGLVWKLQGHYGRMAQVLINQGYCHVNPRFNLDQKRRAV